MMCVLVAKALMLLLVSTSIASALPNSLHPDVAFLVMDDYFKDRSPGQARYMEWQILMDSDDDGTRVSIYNWAGLRYDSPPLSEAVASEIFQPGLVSESSRTVKLTEFMQTKLLPFIDKHVPKGDHRLTGMLIVVPSSFNFHGAEHVRIQVEKEHIFGRFQIVKRDKVLTKIAGYEEARKQRPANFGAISMDSDSVRINWFDDQSGGTLDEFFPGLGFDSARHSYYDLLLYKVKKGGSIAQKLMRNMRKEAPEVEVVEDPCTPQGYNSLPIFRPLDRPYKLLSSLIGGIEEEQSSFKVVGTGHYDKCQALIQEMLNMAIQEKLPCDSHPECSMGQLGQSFIRFRDLGLIGLDEFYNKMSVIFRPKATYNHVAMTSRNKELCSMSWPDFQAMIARKTKENVESYCFYGVYLDTFLSQGLRIPAQYRNLKSYAGVTDIYENQDALRNIWSEARWLDRVDEFEDEKKSSWLSGRR